MPGAEPRTGPPAAPPLILEHLTARPVAECSSAEMAAAMNHVFQDYLVPVALTAENYQRRIRGEHLDLLASRLLLRDGVPIAVLLVARRGWTSRIAAMAVAPQWRGRQLGRELMRGAIDEARARGDRSMVLDVFEQNIRAVRLYTGLGFRPRRRLLGYRWPAFPLTGEVPEAIAEIDPLDFARAVAADGGSDLPWMLAAESLAAASAPARAFSLGGGRAAALIADAEAEVLALAGLVVARSARRLGFGTRLLHALRVHFPGRPWVVPPVVPEDLAHGFLTRLEWEPQLLSQYEMRLDLRSDA
jgi:ribosomal protein S18 acetylase RimI-like enzyme